MALRTWTLPRALELMQAYCRMHGEPPKSAQAMKSAGWPCPNYQVLIKWFGPVRSFRAYVQAAQHAPHQTLYATWIDEAVSLAVLRCRDRLPWLPCKSKDFEAVLQRAAAALQEGVAS